MGNDAQTTNTRGSAGRTPVGTAIPRPGVGAVSPNRYGSLDQARTQYPLDIFNYAARAHDTSFNDYNDIMGSYKNLYDQVSGRPSTTFNWNPVSYSRPGELTEAFGNLRSAGKTYQEFADTGGYSPTDVQELRARGIAPIRAAYGNTIRELDRARSLSGGGANYIAARSRAQRELPGQMADAMTTVNAGLADAIRQGRLSGASGLTNVGSTMGSLSSEEASKILQAAMANSQGQLNAEGMTENARQFDVGMLGNILNSRSGLYGTTPGLSSTFGNQAMSYLNAINAGKSGADVWQKILATAGTAAPYIADAFGGSFGGGGGSGFVSDAVRKTADAATGGGSGLGAKFASFFTPLLNLFRHNGPGTPTGGTGGGGGGGTPTQPDDSLFRRGLGNPKNSGRRNRDGFLLDENGNPIPGTQIPRIGPITPYY